MSRTIAVTGASGFVGGAIARHFAAQGWRVIAFGRRDLQLDGVDYRRWDITEPRAPFTQPVDVVLHSAAQVDDFGAYNAFYRANVQGTQHVLDAFPQAGQFVFISSSSVYDPFAADKTNISETFLYGTRYLNAYGETKMLAEKLLLAQRRENLVILRPRAVYGPGDTTLLPRLVRARRGPLLLGIGDGLNAFSLTYIDNLLCALDLVVERQFGQEIFNIADEITITQRELLCQLAEMMDWQVRRVSIPRRLAYGLAGFSEGWFARFRPDAKPSLTRYAVHQLSSPYTLSIAKAKRMLGYAPPYSYHEGFKLLRGKAE